jgi:hypothetical protein
VRPDVGARHEEDPPLLGDLHGVPVRDVDAELLPFRRPASETVPASRGSRRAHSSANAASQ